MNGVWVVYKGSLGDIFSTTKEVESIWDTEYGADKRAAELNGDDRAIYSSMGWTVQHADAD